MSLSESFTEGYENITNSSNYTHIMDLRQPKTFQGPLLTLFLASTLLSKSQAKPYFLGHEQSPWVPLKLLTPYLPNIPSYWQPINPHRDLTTSSPQIQPPPLSQQQIIHIHDTPPINQALDYDTANSREHNRQHLNEEESDDGSEETNLQSVDYPISILTTPDNSENQFSKTEDVNDDHNVEYDIHADSSNVTYKIIKLIGDNYVNETVEYHTDSNDSVNEFANNTSKKDDTFYDDVRNNITSTETDVQNLENSNKGTLLQSLIDYSINVYKRSRRTTPRPSISRKGTFRKPINDYDSKNRYRNRRRTTTAAYDEYTFSNKQQANRKKRRPPPKNKKPNRRPVNREPEYYDSEYKEEEDYDDYYQNIFARQGITESDTTESSTTTGTTQTTQTTVASTTQAQTENNTQGGYTYGPPIQYGPPPQSGYGPPAQTGYGPSNGNDHISITYPPISGPNRDTLVPLFENWYNQYAKSSILKRLQELLQPSNYYNNPQYDSYDSF